MSRDYRQEYLDFQSSRASKKKRAELNRINHKNNTYGNGDGEDVSHQSDGGTESEDSSTNKGRDEKSRKKGSKRKPFRFWSRKKAEQGILLSPKYKRKKSRVKAQKGLPVFMGFFPEEKKDIMTKSMLEDHLSKTRGQTNEFWEQTGDTIAYHESGPNQRMSPTARQITNNKKKDGVGRGMFMFESKDDVKKDGFETAQKRYSNIAKSKNLGEDPEIMNAKSADELSKDQQYALLYSDLIEGPAKLSDYAEGKMSIEDLWIKGHKKKEVPGDRESFEESRKDSEEGLKKYGLRKGGVVRRKAQKG
jgi:hypothetical protein